MLTDTVRTGGYERAICDNAAFFKDKVHACSEIRSVASGFRCVVLHGFGPVEFGFLFFVFGSLSLPSFAWLSSFCLCSSLPTCVSALSSYPYSPPLSSSFSTPCPPGAICLTPPDIAPSPPPKKKLIRRERLHTSLPPQDGNSLTKHLQKAPRSVSPAPQHSSL